MPLYSTTINYFLTVKEVNRVTKKINKLTYHCGRCKNPSDIIKLVALITVNATYLKLLIDNIDKEVKLLCENHVAY